MKQILMKIVNILFFCYSFYLICIYYIDKGMILFKIRNILKTVCLQLNNLKKIFQEVLFKVKDIFKEC